MNKWIVNERTATTRCIDQSVAQNANTVSWLVMKSEVSNIIAGDEIRNIVFSFVCVQDLGRICSWVVGSFLRPFKNCLL